MESDPRRPIWTAVLRNLDRRKDIFAKLRFQDGMSLHAIAARMGVSDRTLKTWINRNDIPYKRQRAETEQEKKDEEGE